MNYIRVIFLLLFFILIISILFVICAAITSSRISRMEEYEEIMRKLKK